MAKSSSLPSWLKYAILVVLLGLTVEMFTRGGGSRVPKSPPGIITSPDEYKLLARMIARGGHSLLTIGRRCPQCPRGAFAARNIRKGELALAVPLKYGVPLAKLPYHAYAPELSYYMMIAMHISPEFNRSHPYYFETMPSPEDNLDVSNIPEEMLQETQTEQIVFGAKDWKRLTELMYNGSANIQGFSYISLNNATRGDISLETYAHITALVRSRDFVVHEKTGPRTYLLPVMDMINHEYGDRVSLGIPANNGTHMLQTAVKDVKKGEELFWDYNPNTCHRNDIVMLTYGMVLDQNPPLLCTFDLPDYVHVRQQGKYPDNDAEYYGLKGRFNTQSEYNRLSSLLSAMPTTIEEDQALLKSGTLPTWKHSVIVEFRLARKLALKNAMDQIAKYGTNISTN